VLSWQLGPWETFWIFFYGFATWGNAGFMREQVCKYMCPYARFQGVMFDPDTLIVTYDAERGEPRGARNKKARPQGRRQGRLRRLRHLRAGLPDRHRHPQRPAVRVHRLLACIDACDQVMDKMAYPRGLIRYSTEHAVIVRVLAPGDAGKTGSNPIFFEVKAINHEEVFVREKTTFLLP
jgi:polyferredoxin